MRSSNKSRSRNKGNRRNNNIGNVINRVFDSAGPDGRVRGTPQQIIEKYRALAHDASLADDRVGAENFQQHAEHYARLLSAAQAEIAERQAQRQAQQNAQQQSYDNDDSQNDDGHQAANDGQEESNLVETPEGAKQPKPRQKQPRQRRKPAPGEETPASEAGDNSDIKAEAS